MEKTLEDKSRHVELLVTIGGHDATDFLSPSLTDFSFTDNAGGKADEINITLHDRDGHWHGDWQPSIGTAINAKIICNNWEEKGQSISLNCGRFIIDEITFSGPPNTVQLKALSASLVSGVRDEIKTKAWENYSLASLAGEIAQNNELELKYYGDEIKLGRKDQREESDLAFLQRIANSNGMNVKVHDGKLILFDIEKADAKPSVLTIPRLGHGSPTSFSFKKSSSGTSYNSASVAYTDPKTGTTHKADIQPNTQTNIDAGEKNTKEKKLVINQRVENLAEAEKLGKSELRKKNTKAETATLEIMGNPLFRAGVNVSLAGFGEFDGAWAIETASHKIGSNYGVSLSIRKVIIMRVQTTLADTTI